MITGLRAMSIVEATTYLALLAATVYKYVAANTWGVQVLGPIHGVLYLVFAAMVFLTRSRLGWSGQKAVYAVVLGALPFGGFWVESRWLRPLRT